MPRQVHVGGRREGCRGTGGHMQVTIVNTSRKKEKEKTYLLAQAGRCGHRQVGRHRQEWAQGKKVWGCPDRCMWVGTGRGVDAQVDACRLQS